MTGRIVIELGNPAKNSIGPKSPNLLAFERRSLAPTHRNNFYAATEPASWCARTLEMRCFAGAAAAGGLSGACAVELWVGGGGTIAKSIRPRTIIPRIAMIIMFQCRKLTTLFLRSPC